MLTWGVKLAKPPASDLSLYLVKPRRFLNNAIPDRSGLASGALQ